MEEEKNNESRAGARARQALRALQGSTNSSPPRFKRCRAPLRISKGRWFLPTLFQTPKRQEASAFGAFNSFFVLPVGVLVYAILLRTVFNPIESETEMIVTKNCTPFNFTCTTLYGCEVAAMGKRTTEKFSRKNESLFLKQGQRMNETICPGLNEALDIAPRAAVDVGDDYIKSSFEHEGMGYFGVIKGIVYQVNLTNMRLMNQSKLSYSCFLDRLCVQVGMGMLVVTRRSVKFDLKTLAKVKSVEVQDVIQTGFAYNGYGYFYDHGITQVDLTTMEVIKQKPIRAIIYMASSLGRTDIQRATVSSAVDKKNHLSGEFDIFGITPSKSLGERLTSACCGGAKWGTESGKILGSIRIEWRKEHFQHK